MTSVLLKIGRGALAICIFFLRKITNNHIPPVPSAHLLLFKADKYLVVRRNDGQGLGFPAGIVNWNETPAQTAARETLEETGLKAEVTRLVGVYSHPGSRALSLNSIYIVYSGKITGGRLHNSLECQPVWLTKDEIINTQPALAPLIRDHERRKR